MSNQEKSCSNCRFVVKRDNYNRLWECSKAKPRLDRTNYSFIPETCNWQRLDGFIAARIFGTCGKSGRWWKQPEPPK